MPNNLTGDYEAIFQISVRQINGLLASMHQRGIDPKASPTFPHNNIIAVGQLPAFVQPGNQNFLQWLGVVGQSYREAGGFSENLGATLATRVLPEVATLYKKALSEWEAGRVEITPSGKARGNAYVQISNPTITLRPRSTSEIRVNVFVRADFVPDSGAGALPEPIHGEVQAYYSATTKMVNGRRVVCVQVPSDDANIQFFSAPGTLSAADTATVAAEIRKALRKQFAPTDVEVPDDFPFSEFIALGTGDTIALPLQLPGSPSPAGNIQSVTNNLLAGNEFAIAVSKESVQSRFQPLIDQINAYVTSFRVEYAGATYRASISPINIVWKTGGIDISAKIDLTTPTVYAPDGWISFTQTLTVELDVATQSVAIKPVGDPIVDESWWMPHGKAVDAVKKARDGALPGASQALNAAFNTARNALIDGLRRFDQYAFARYLTVEITPDGIILRGKIDSSGRLNPVVSFSETPDRKSFTAFQSWIPGGFIDTYEWTWPEGAAWFSQIGSSDDSHRFILPKPKGITVTSQICLRIYGTRITADGFIENVTEGETCEPSWSEPLLVQPPWWIKVMVPVWLPDPPPEFRLEDAILGYINVAGPSRDPGRLNTNTLVHFTGERLEKPLEQLGQVMRQSQRQDGSLMLILVLPAGTFRESRRDVENRLGSLGERFAGHLMITEDYLEGWTKAFSAREAPSTFFLNARREFVWKHTGKIDARTFAAALEEHMVPAPAAPTTLMQLHTQPGDFALDAVLEDDRGEKFAIHRLRGRQVILNFWQSWAKPCLRELQALQRRHDQEGENAPLILAINGGEEQNVFEEVRRENNLTFPLVYDPDQSIATLYGIQCWPTTVSVNREGIVERVQFGLSHERREEGAKAAH